MAPNPPTDGEHAAFAFPVASPLELPRRHGELLDRALQPRETIHALIYSPPWKGQWMPFGVRARPASYAVAATDRRLLISVDEQAPASRPCLAAVGHADVLTVHHGSAMLLGWMVVRYPERGRTATAAVLYNSIGSRHFAACLRAHRALVAEEGPCAPSSADGMPRAPAAGAAALQPSLSEILLPGERVTAVTGLAHRWSRRRRGLRHVWQPAAPGVLLVGTSRGLLLARLEAPAIPGALSFGAEMICFRPGGLESWDVAPPVASGPCTIRLRLRSGAAALELEASVEPADVDDALDILRFVSRSPQRRAAP